jgi:hypothetical protein
VKRKKPLLTKKHRRERLDFVIKHKDWTLKDWKKVVWSDETKSTSLGQMEGKGSGRRQGSHWVTGQWRGHWISGVDLWWCEAACCGMELGIYARFKGGWKGTSTSRSSSRKPQILWQISRGGHLPARQWPQAYLQKGQDLVSRSWFPGPLLASTVSRLQSHWTLVRSSQEEAGRIWETPFWNARTVGKEWNKIDAVVCQNLIESMPRRVAAVLKAKGGYSKYQIIALVTVLIGGNKIVQMILPQTVVLSWP